MTILSKLALIDVDWVDIREPRHAFIRKEVQKYHLKYEGHRPTYANRLVKAQLQILLRGQEDQLRSHYQTHCLVRLSS